MTRRLLAGLAIVGVTTVALVQLDSIAAVLAWEVVVIVAVAMVGWHRWPARPRESGLLFGVGSGIRSRLPHTLTPLELEVAAALDPTLAGADVLRRRLLGLIRHRSGLGDGPVDALVGRELLGDAAWESLAGGGPLVIAELDHVVDRIEAL